MTAAQPDDVDERQNEHGDDGDEGQARAAAMLPRAQSRGT